MQYLLPSLRLWLVSLIVCVLAYSALVLAFAQAVVPERANGSIVSVDGRPVGSRLIAQGFTSPRYFWPRPSAPEYNAMGAAGSNKSPTSPDLVARAQETITAYDASAANPIPADLVAASGGGLDPHVSLAGALYQTPRVAAARGIPEAELRAMVERLAQAPGGALAPDRIVNVLELNLALDAGAR